MIVYKRNVFKQTTYNLSKISSFCYRKKPGENIKEGKNLEMDWGQENISSIFKMHSSVCLQLGRNNHAGVKVGEVVDFEREEKQVGKHQFELIALVQLPPCSTSQKPSVTLQYPQEKSLYLDPPTILYQLLFFLFFFPVACRFSILVQVFMS